MTRILIPAGLAARFNVERMKLIAFVLMCFSVSAQEMALRPVPKPQCETAISVDSVKSCTFRQYRFSLSPSGDGNDFTVSRMEGGRYIATSLRQIAKHPEKALQLINTRMAKDRQQKRKAGVSCLDDPIGWLDLVLQIDDNRAVFESRYSSCGQAQFTIRELDSMLR